MNNICDCFKKVPRIPRGNDFKFLLHLVESIVVGFHQVEEREVQGTVSVESVKLYNPNGVVGKITQGSASNGTNTYSINDKNTIMICFNNELPVGKYGIEVLFTVSHENSKVVEDRRFYAPPGYGFYIVESTPEGFIPSDKVMTYEIAANLGLGTLVDLSGYPTNQQLTDGLNGKVDKVEGKDLSTNDFSDEYKEKVDSSPMSVGYFTCETNASTAAKTVTASGYKLQNGGAIKIYMANGNTASSPTLNINATGAKPIYYNGAIASPTNSWEAGEVIEVYYDGTNYQATNFQGGGSFSTGEKVGEVGITDEATQDSDDLITSGAVYSMMNAISSGAGVSASASPSVIYKNTATNVTVSATMKISLSASSIQIKDGNTVEHSGTNTNSISKTLSLNISADKTYNIVATYQGMTFNASVKVSARNPIYVGMGTSASAVAVSANRLTARTSASGTYTKSATANGQHFYILVPIDVLALSIFTMGGAPFAMTSTTQTINGISYNVYESGATYNSGTQVNVTAS